MIYITLLIFIEEGKETIFQEFEKLALSTLKEFNGRLLLRLRPNDSSVVSVEGECPYEMHFLSFASNDDFIAYTKDSRRKEFLHLKEQSIKATLLVKGEQL